ncbi:MAG: heme ABC transporter ATP-binding protein [Myxococcales bacterium]|nr:heme ABC transporter ATP-binding protein [Myxococcales bacterium]
MSAVEQNPTNIKAKPTASPALRVENLWVDRGTRSVIQDLSLSLLPGGLTALLGPNGAGKSTLFEAISGTLSINRGHISLYGESLNLMSPTKRAQYMGVLHQDTELSFGLTVREVVTLGRLAFTEPLAQQKLFVERALDQMKLSVLSHRSYLTLSGGEKRRVQMARVLAQVLHSEEDSGKKTILADEPTAALDLSYQHSLLARLRSLAQEGAAVLTIVHDVNLAARYADRIIFLKAGEIVADGTPAAVICPPVLQTVFGVEAQVEARDFGPLAIISGAANNTSKEN